MKMQLLGCAKGRKKYPSGTRQDNGRLRSMSAHDGLDEFSAVFALALTVEVEGDGVGEVNRL